MKTGCSVDPFLNTTLFSTQVATCRFMYLKPNTSPFCGCHQKKRHLIHSTQWFTHVTKKGKYSKFSCIIWQLVPIPWMAVWLLIEHWHLLNAMGVFSLAVWNTTMKITGIFWQGPPLLIYITQHNKIWATWRDWSLISSLYGNMNGSSWQELLCQGAHTAHSQRCFFWWQKNAICLSYKASPDEKFHYCDITCFVPRKTIPLWARKNNFGEFQHSTSIFQEDQKKKKIPTSRALFSQYLDRLTLTIVFLVSLFCWNLPGHLHPQGRTKSPCGHLVYPGSELVFEGDSCDTLPSGILNRGVNNLFWDYTNLLQKQDASD